MTIAITWATGVIYVPKADMTLIQSMPTVIYELNIDDFRLTLKSLEDDAAGMGFQKTHDHNTTVLLGGIEYARLIEILPPYTVTFEDGQYAVNLFGANSNIGDRVNVNQVSVRSANSAGMTSSAAIEYASFNGGVTIDIINGVTGTTYPIGTPQKSVNNLADAKLIAEVRGFESLYIIGNITFTSGQSVDAYTIYGQNPRKTTVTLESGLSTNGAEFIDCTLIGTLDGDTWFRHCIIGTLTYVQGQIEQCVLSDVITLSGTETVRLIDCTDGVPGYNSLPLINMGGTGRNIIISEYFGTIVIGDLTGNNIVEISMGSGHVHLLDTVTSGEIFLRGTGTYHDESSGTTLDVDALICIPRIVDAVWDATMADHIIPGSTGAKLNEGATVDASEIADAVWDELLADHDITGSAGEYLTAFYNALASGEVYVASSTAAEITMVRDKLGDAGVQITETIIDEEAISESKNVVFPAERMIYSVTSVYLASDPTHAGTEYYGDTGSFDQYTGAITLKTALPDDNTQVLINYTMMRGIPDTVIDWFLDEAKLYVSDYTKETYTWSDGLGIDPDIRTRVALLASISYAAMQCLESIATGDIIQLGYEFRFGDLEVNNQVTGGFHVQAHIDLLKSDIERKLSILGRKMTFVMRSTKALGRGAWGYKRSASGRRQVY